MQEPLDVTYHDEVPRPLLAPQVDLMDEFYLHIVPGRIVKHQDFELAHPLSRLRAPFHPVIDPPCSGEKFGG